MVPSLISESLWQMPHASTLMRTCPPAGSGISRSTSSNGPFGRVTCTTRIFDIVPPRYSYLMNACKTPRKLVLLQFGSVTAATQLHQNGGADRGPQPGSPAGVVVATGSSAKSATSVELWISVLDYHWARPGRSVVECFTCFLTKLHQNSLVFVNSPP